MIIGTVTVVATEMELRDGSDGDEARRGEGELDREIASGREVFFP